MRRPASPLLRSLIFPALLGLAACSGGRGSGASTTEDRGNAASPAAPAPALSPALTTITGPASTVADGSTAATVTIKLLREDGTGYQGIVPTFRATDTGATNVYGACAISDAFGVSTCALAATKAEVKTLELLSPVAKAGTAVAFVPGAADAVHSSIAASGPVVADGTSASTITISLRDAFGNALTGVTPAFSATDTANRNSAVACAATDAAGASTCSLRSTYAETKTVQLTSPLTLTGGSVVFTSGGLDLESRFELLDYGASSLTTARTFARSEVGLDTADYDGTVHYSLEIAAYNGNVGADYDVKLVDETAATIATITVPMGTTTTTSFKTDFTPIAGAGKSYRLALPATAVANELILTTARIAVRQTRATRTRLYVPLLQAGYNSYSNSDVVAVDTVVGTSYTQTSPDVYSFFNRNDAAFKTLDATAPYTLEVLLSTSSAGSTASTALFRVSDGSKIASSETTATATTPTRRQVVLGADFTDAASYELRLKTDTSSARLLRAGIWIKLNNLTKAETFTRVARVRSGSSSVTLPDQRVPLDLSLFSNGKVYLEATGSSSVAGGSSAALLDAGSAVSGTAGTTVAGSSVALGTTKATARSGDLTSALVRGHALILRHLVSAGTGKVNNSCLVVGVSQ